MRIIYPLFLVLLFSCKEKSEPFADTTETADYVEKRMSEINEDAASKALSTISHAPLQIVGAVIVDENVEVTFKNPTKDTVDGLRVGMYFYNNFGEQVKDASGNPLKVGETQSTILPGAEETIQWNLSEFSRATKVKPYISEIHFTNDFSWDYKNFIRKPQSP